MGEIKVKLTKKIPARTKTVRFAWCVKNAMQCTERYRRIREGLRGQRSGSMTKCDWCKRRFDDDEWFALAQPLPRQEGPKRNWALCHKCADLIGATSVKKKASK